MTECREQARGTLTQSTYTEFYWKIDYIISCIIFVSEWNQVQKEIRDYANVIYELVQPLVPITMKAFMDFRMN